MKSMFKGAQAKASMLQWFDRFRERIPAPTESRTVSTRFGDTHVLVAGPEEGPSLVVLHGALANSAIALVEMAPLLKHFRVYSVDVIGQSVKSADTRPSVSNNDYGLWLQDVLDALSLQKPHVVGVSWGGFVAIRLAACAPERINRLVSLVQFRGHPRCDGRSAGCPRAKRSRRRPEGSAGSTRRSSKPER